jgi:LPS sulfotransferase NodH
MDHQNIRSTENLIEGFDRSIHFLAKRVPQKVKVINILLSQPRTGSTLLCDYLTMAGDIGICDEWINPILLKKVGDYIGAQSFSEILGWILSRTASPQGIVTINIQIPHLIHLKKAGIEFNMKGKRIVYLMRSNKIEQAISLAKARKTKLYVKLGDEKINNPDLNYSEVAAALATICQYDGLSQKILVHKKYLEIAYEDVVANELVIDKVFDYLGSSGRSAEKKTNIKKQSTVDDLHVAENFLRYISGSKKEKYESTADGMDGGA